jgi:hypothetical protein
VFRARTVVEPATAPPAVRFGETVAAEAFVAETFYLWTAWLDV